MKTFSFTIEQLRILQAVISHANANKFEAEEELGTTLDGIEELEKLLYQDETICIECIEKEEDKEQDDEDEGEANEQVRLRAKHEEDYYRKGADNYED